jgi:hypothetical protein
MIQEKEKLLAEEKKLLQVEREKNTKAEEIILQNKLIMEAQQRKEFSLKQSADSTRLEEIHKKVSFRFGLGGI